MKRLHIHISVKDLPESIAFYSAMFDSAPTKEKPDYAQWKLDNPRINFAISKGMVKKGLDHLGIQYDDEAELDGFRAHLAQAEISTHSDGQTDCCYATSEKSWIKDPNGIAWEAFYTMNEAEKFHGEKKKSSCCIPSILTKKSSSCGTGTSDCC